jgi:hypothetical protein
VGEDEIVALLCVRNARGIHSIDRAEVRRPTHGHERRLQALRSGVIWCDDCSIQRSYNETKCRPGNQADVSGEPCTVDAADQEPGASLPLPRPVR